MSEKLVLSACPHDCPDTCAMITTVRDSVAVKVRGNPDHPFTRGGLCVKVNDGSVKNLGRYATSWLACWLKRPSSTAALT